MHKNPIQGKNKIKKPFRIFAKSSDYLIADIWATNQGEAERLARDIDGGCFRDMAGDWELELVRKIEPHDTEFEPFLPLN